MNRPSKKTRFQPGKIVILVFIGVFLASIWPVSPLFSRIDPVIFGLPFSLVYLIVLLAISFSTLLALYLWESRKGRLD